VKNKNARNICAAPNSERSTPNFILTELLSIDADAHLQKLTAHIFPSPALLPVELVRSALKRKATAIAIQVRPERIVISDNGSGIDSTEWQTLACLGDSGQSAAAREKAIALIQGLAHPGIGLLAVFLPGVRSLQIETVGLSGAMTLAMAAGRIKLKNSSAWPRGTRISITRRRGPAAEEKVLLARLCAAINAEITINGRQLKKKPLLTNNLASIDIAIAENSGPSLLAIPVQGDVCRVWLLDQGIPWQATSMAPVQGLVFATALETSDNLAPPALATLAANANRLYHWLAENYNEFPGPLQARIEDLFFRLARAGGDQGLLSLCAPFLTWPSWQRISLAAVRRKAMNGVLYAMDRDNQPGHSSNPDSDMLLLTQLQKDFLINHLRLPIIILGRQQKIRIRPRKIFLFCRDRLLRLRRLVNPARARISDCNSLSPEEKILCLELEMHWRQIITRTAPAKETMPLSVVMVEGRGLVPAFWLKNAKGDMLRIRRRHPLTLRSLQSLRQDRDNSELACAALMPGYFLTDDRQ
jgi:hypothetical protein